MTILKLQLIRRLLLQIVRMIDDELRLRGAMPAERIEVRYELRGD